MMLLAMLQTAAPAAAEALDEVSVPGLPPAPTSAELDTLQLILHASLPVQLVMLLLLLASIASWVIIFRKRKVLGDASNEADEFEERFWSGGDLAALFRDVSGRDQRPTGLAAIFEAGFREFARLRQKRGSDSRIQVEGAQRAMRASLAREVDALERYGSDTSQPYEERFFEQLAHRRPFPSAVALLTLPKPLVSGGQERWAGQEG